MHEKQMPKTYSETSQTYTICNIATSHEPTFFFKTYIPEYHQKRNTCETHNPKDQYKIYEQSHSNLFLNSLQNRTLTCIPKKSTNKIFQPKIPRGTSNLFKF